MKRKNKSTLLVCINCMIITLAILLLPLAFFETSIYVKRSANTFVGDEKYVEARAEVEAVAAQHEGAVIEESVTERVNSKGVTTSMVTFTVKETIRRNGLDFLLHGVGHSEGMSGVGPANVMRLLLGSMAVSLVLLLCAITCLRCGELKKTLARGGLYLFVIALCIFILYPFYVMLITGFRSNAETTDMYFLHMMPTKWIWSNLKDICDRGVLRFLLNSIMLSTGATAIAMLCGIPAAYAMARMHFKGRSLFLGFVIMSQMFSPVVLLVGISQLMNTLHLNDTILGLMLINAAFNQAFAIWLLRGTFVSISPEMEQAACIDGCNTVGALWNILLPMAAPGIVTTLIFVFINSWNEYTISTVLISTPTNKPITVGITQFSSFNMIEWQYLFAAALLATIPVIILFMFIEKHLAEGLTSGGVKG